MLNDEGLLGRPANYLLKPCYLLYLKISNIKNWKSLTKSWSWYLARRLDSPQNKIQCWIKRRVADKAFADELQEITLPITKSAVLFPHLAQGLAAVGGHPMLTGSACVDMFATQTWETPCSVEEAGKATEVGESPWTDPKAKIVGQLLIMHSSTSCLFNLFTSFPH